MEETAKERTLAKAKQHRDLGPSRNWATHLLEQQRDSEVQDSHQL